MIVIEELDRIVYSRFLHIPVFPSLESKNMHVPHLVMFNRNFFGVAVIVMKPITPSQIRIGSAVCDRDIFTGFIHGSLDGNGKTEWLRLSGSKFVVITDINIEKSGNIFVIKVFDAVVEKSFVFRMKMQKFLRLVNAESIDLWLDGYNTVGSLGPKSRCEREEEDRILIRELGIAIPCLADVVLKRDLK